MEDYELLNALEWDPNAPVVAEPIEHAWIEVKSKKQKKKAQTQPSVQPPPFQLQHQHQHRRPCQHRPLQLALGGNRRHSLLQTSTSGQARSVPNSATLIASHRGSRKNAFQKSAKAPTKPARLIDDAEDEAVLSWRARQPPADAVRIPAYMVLADQEMQQEGGELATYQRLAVDAGAHVCYEEGGSSNTSLCFGIWGTSSAAAAAKAAIVEWIDIAAPSSKSVARDKFPRSISLTPELRKRAERRFRRDVKRSRFRRVPPADMAFEAIGSFHWPCTEWRPEESFGTSCEALDPIRMDLECYIIFCKERSMFQVCGKAADVQTALCRIRRTVFQMAARSINPVRAYLLRWQESIGVPTHVYLEKHCVPKAIAPEPAKIPKATYSPRAEGSQDDHNVIERQVTTSALSVERIRVTLGNAFRKAHYQRGSLQLRVRLGIFVLTNYITPEDGEEEGLYELAEYEEMTASSPFRGCVTDELGDAATEQQARANVLQADSLLSPQGALTERLRDVLPVYRASFILSDPEDPVKGDLHLFLEFDEIREEGAQKPHFLERTRRWTRSDPDSGTVIKLVDMSLTDLHTGSAWQFELTRGDSLDPKHLSRTLTAFANGVRIDASAALARNHQKPLVKFNPFVQLKSFRQSMVYQYAINESDYTLELAHFQDREYTQAERGLPRVYEPRWSVNVLRVEWDTMFAKNERLAIGASADWDDDIDNWFPKAWGSDEGGFALLMRKLGLIEKLVRAVPEGSEERDV